MTGLTCPYCGGRMKEATLSSGCLGVLVALIVFFAGLFVTVFFFFTIIGPIIGILMMIAAIPIGGKRRRVWKCKSCGCVFDRA